MKVLLLGGTGNLGSRLVPALLAHKHKLTVLVRNRQKLQSLLPRSVPGSISIVEGNAASKTDVLNCLRKHAIEGVVNTAGAAPIWKTSQLPLLNVAITEALEKFGEERKTDIRAWYMGGYIMLDLPGNPGKLKLVDYFPLYKEHIHTLSVVAASKNIAWSLLAPAKMDPLSTSILTPEQHTTLQQNRRPLMGNISVPPEWKYSWFRNTWVVGNYIDILSNSLSLRYSVALEDVAEFIARDLENSGKEYVHERVGLIQLCK